MDSVGNFECKNTMRYLKCSDEKEVCESWIRRDVDDIKQDCAMRDTKDRIYSSSHYLPIFIGKRLKMLECCEL